MKKASSNSGSTLDRVRSWTRTTLHGDSESTKDTNSTLPISNPSRDGSTNLPPFASADLASQVLPSNHTHSHAADTSADLPTPASSTEVDREGAVMNDKDGVVRRFYLTAKSIIFSSYINLLLVFVPIGVASHVAHLNAGITFGMNAVAIIPLAGLLSFATESVAHRMGDTIGALMNVSFGNAVELIIFMYVSLGDQGKKVREALLKALSYQSRPISFINIALTKNEIRIVQAALLGSILANLLLILGMCFLVGGLRYREQIYNSTVTQMSACLLSLAVMSLLLPTAFHASFNEANKEKAERSVLKVSRGTSVILLIVYGMYLLFQLKSHAYMYQSTPQHILDEEMAPGPVAAWMDTSSGSSSSSSSSDSDSSSNSHTTTRKRIKRVMRRHRKSSVSSKDTNKQVTDSNLTTGTTSPNETVPSNANQSRLPTLDFAEDGDDEKTSRRGSKASRASPAKERKKDRKRREKRERKSRREADSTVTQVQSGEKSVQSVEEIAGTRQVDFATQNEPATESDATTKRPFNLRSITNLRPQLPAALSQNVFTQPAPLPATPGHVPRVRYGIRRTNSLPGRLDENVAVSRHQSTPVEPVQSPPAPVVEVEHNTLSQTSAVILLLVSTGLVAVCADFLVESIDAVVESNSGISEVFIGLIILPIVGNAAEHFTAVTVALYRNNMDLAIGVAVGSSIQIALFVTPFVVLLGWCMDKDMSLYFNLFETVSLFAAAFIVNFLVLDGRSNYLEGALLLAAYSIIAVAAFFYPNADQQSSLGNPDATRRMIRSLLG